MSYTCQADGSGVRQGMALARLSGSAGQSVFKTPSADSYHDHAGRYRRTQR
jgi:hypothetical protein